MNIIEKLGITPGCWEVNTKGLRKGAADVVVGNVFFKTCGFIAQYVKTENARLIAAAPQILEALIMLHFEQGDERWSPYVRSIIESATGKSWEEIKALMENEG